MAGRALVEGTRSMIIFLFRAIVFPMAWLWAMAIAKKHEDADPKARRKVAAAIVVGVLATGAIGFMLYDFQEDTRANMYDRMNDKLSQVYGASAFEEQGKNIIAKSNQRDILQRQLDVGNEQLAQYAAEGNLTAYEEMAGNVATFQANLFIALHDLEWATIYQDRLNEENRFYNSIQGHIANQDDDALMAAATQRQADQTRGDEALRTNLLDAEKDLQKARSEHEAAQAQVLYYDLLEDVRPLTAEEQELADAAAAELAETSAERDAAEAAASAARAAATGSIELPVPEDVYRSEKLPGRTTYHLNIKTSADEDMMVWMNYLLYPGLIGVFYAPLMIALGSVMANAWEPSESVGYKKYPGASLGLFLFFGAFGWPALLFSAWGFWDIDVRSKEGQISL